MLKNCILNMSYSSLMTFFEKNVRKKVLLEVHFQLTRIIYVQIHRYQHHLNFAHVFYQAVQEKNDNMKVTPMYYFQFQPI